MQRVNIQRLLLIGAAAVTASFSYTAPALAQDGELEEVIITGTRARARSATESPAPVDVIGGDDFAKASCLLRSARAVFLLAIISQSAKTSVPAT